MKKALLFMICWMVALIGNARKAEPPVDPFVLNEAVETLSLDSTLIALRYAKASDIAHLLQGKKNAWLSPQGSVGIDVRTNTLLLRDTPEKLKIIQPLVRALDIPVRQVSIEARIVTVNKACADDIGVRLGLTKMLGVKSPSGEALADRLNVDLGVSPLGGPPATLGFTLATLGRGILLDLELSALESEGQGQIMASPKLITTNRHPAVIESGEEIPYQEATLSGATAVAFKKAVLRLKVTPEITPDNQLVMDLSINQDTRGPQTYQGVPVILTKSLKTRVLVKHGQTVVLGGIYKQDKNNIINRVPLLSTLPIVGNLFRQRSTLINQEELLIFITPRIIRNVYS